MSAGGIAASLEFHDKGLNYFSFGGVDLLRGLFAGVFSFSLGISVLFFGWGSGFRSGIRFGAVVFPAPLPGLLFLFQTNVVHVAGFPVLVDGFLEEIA